MSSPLAIGVLMACAAFTVGTAAGWCLTCLTASLARRGRWTARARSVVMAQLRLLPLATSIVLVGAQLSAFAQFEQRRTESAGPLLVVLAAIGLLLLCDAVWTTVRTWRFTHHTLKTMRRQARPVALADWAGPAWLLSSPAPVVLVAGNIKPQLFIASRVLHHCTHDEVAAIVAHEEAHVRAHDNLVQYLFRLTPGARFAGQLAISLEREWRAATEEAADRAAARRAGNLALASALIKVARLTPIAQPLAASALIGESNLDVRVRRLLDGGAKAPPSKGTSSEGATLVAPPLLWLPFLLMLAAAAFLSTPPVGAALHELFETLVRVS